MENVDSVYELITNLCGKFTNDPEIIKKYRQQCYEILLKKRKSTNNTPTEHKYIESTDVLTNVYIWQFILAKKYNLKEHAKKLVGIGENCHKIYGDDIIKFLLLLRQIPQNSDDFHIFSDDLLSQQILNNTNINQQQQQQIENIDNNQTDIWENVLNENYCKRRTWECYNCVESNKELLFLSESSGSLWMKNLPSTYTNNNKQINLNIKTMKEFINDLKYLLVGMASYSFNYDEQLKKFVFLSNITIETVSRDSLEQLCNDLMICGNYFKQLQNLTTINQYTGKYQQDGYIFAVFHSN